jgi:tetratricopeptide (TPR) repeat protein
MYSAQAQLADAYIEAGFAEEARFIAEDLVAREPWDRANIERFRRALVLMGEPDPDALIAQRLSGQSPFMSTDLSSDAEELPDFDVPAAREEERVANSRQSDHFELSANAIDVEGILSDLEKPPAAHGRSEGVEVDLSIVLDDINERQAKPAPARPPSEPGEGDLDGVFLHARDEASRRSALEAAEAEYERGLALHKAGQIDECIPSLQAASRAPRLRFVTALLLGRIYRDRGMTPQAIEWFERAAEAPAPTLGEGHALLYELADALESVGEVARALAICMELQADVGDYRDVAARVDRLAKVQTRG